MTSRLWAVALALTIGFAGLPGSAVADPSPADVRRAVDLLAAQDYAEAASEARDELLSTYVQWRALREGPQQSFSRYRDFIEQHPSWPDAARLQVRGEPAVDPQESPADLVTFFTAHEPRTEGGRLAFLTALASTQDTRRTQELARRIWVEDDFSGIEENAFLGQFAGYLGPEQDVARLDRLLWDGRTSDAMRILPRVPGDVRALATARMRLQQGARNADAALAAVPPTLQGDPGLAFDRMKWRRARGQDAAVEEILLSVRSEPEKPAAWWAERSRASRKAMDDGDYARAYRLASTHKQTDGTEFAEAEWLSGWLALRFLHDPATALRHFERFFEKVATPISRARGAYWAGRASAERGDQSGATRWYEKAAANPTAFYGQLAAGELGQPLRFDNVIVTPPDEPARAQFRRRDTARLAEYLCAAGAQRKSLPFLRQLGTEAGTDGPALELVYDLARRCARPDLVVVVAKAAVLNGAEALPTFPIPDVAAMLSPAEGRPDPQLILAIARQESQFDPRAMSKVGARGLMQLMPTTARGVARTLSLPFDVEALTEDPDFNVQLGSWYLGRQLSHYDGSVALAAAAYNAGPGRVDEWLARYGDPRGKSMHELADWIELIPFTETRNYVQRVVEGQAVYGTLLEQGGGRLVPVPGARQGTAAIRDAADRS